MENFQSIQESFQKKIANNLLLPKEEMINSIKQITTISTDVKITLLSDAIIFNSLSADNVEAKTKLGN